MQLIGHHNYRSRNIRFGSADDYEKAEIPPTDWAKEEITYSYNRFGFRCAEFKNIQWEDSIVLLGCSCTAGIGLPEADTVGKQLEAMTGIPTVNLGVSGSAVDLACWNSIILHDHFPHPVAVVQIWTDMCRYSDIHNDKLECYYPRRTDYMANYNWDKRSAFYIKTDRQLWNNKNTRYFECTFFNSTSRAVGVPSVAKPDQAWDGMHPGVESNLNMAQLIRKGLNL